MDKRAAALVLALVGVAAPRAGAGPLEDAADRTLAAAFPPATGGWRWEPLGPPPRLPAEGNVLCAADPVDATPRPLVSLAVRVSVDGRPWKTVLLSYRLRRTARVWTLRRPRSPGDPVSAADLIAERRDVAPLDRFLSPADLPDHEWTRAAPAGAALIPGWVRPRPVVKLGEAVRVTVSTGEVRLTASGRALRDGRLGDAIPVRLESARRPVTAMVRGPGRLELPAPAGVR